MKAAITGEEVPVRYSLQGAQLEAKEAELLLGPASNQTLPFAFGARNNATSLWNLSSPNIGSTERLVTLDHIEESENEAALPGAIADASLVAKLREQAATADKALRLKALQVEEYERELELVHEKLTEVERKNEQLRSGFEKKLTQLEQNIHLRKPEPTPNPSIGPLKALRASIGATRKEAARIQEELRVLAAQGKADSTRAKTLIEGQQKVHEDMANELSKLREELLQASRSLSAGASLQATVDELRGKQQRLFSGRCRLLRDIKAAAEAQAEMLLDKARMEVSLSEVNRQLTQVSENYEDCREKKQRMREQLEKCGTQLKFAQDRLVAQTLRLGRAQTRTTLLQRKLRKAKRHIRSLDQKPAAKERVAEEEQSAGRQRPSRARKVELPHHSCLTGRSLCPRRAYMEALKRAHGL